MAIEYNLIFQGKELTEKILLEELKDIGLECKNPIKLNEGIEISQFVDTTGLIIYLTTTTITPPNDSLEFEFLKKEFHFGNWLTFWHDKLFDREIQRKTMLLVIFSVINRLKTNAILAYDVDTLYCFFSKSGELFVNTQTEIDKDPDFLQLSAGWIVKDIEKNTVEF